MYIADLHIHSRFSRATSKEGTPEHLDLWARRKGIQIVGTGDFTHPVWREELKEKLMPAEEGLYMLKPEYRIRDGSVADTMIPRFVVTGEISSIYKQGEKVRKVHSLILLPGLEAAEILSEKLEEIGNIHSDGRPILGLSCHDLLEIVLQLCPGAVYVPAHIWTPHFSLFGAFSGFDSMEECFGDLTSHIHAVETGLSSDPPMNWRVSALDRLQLISNSDAHSPSKLGREANLLEIELSYEGLRKAVETGNGLSGTIEFFPEEGKYHMDGHRKCGLCLTPQETEQYHGICPVCGKKITIGVSHRVDQLSDRAEGYVKPDAKKFENLMPLAEVIGTAAGSSPASVKVQREYGKMLQKLGPEFQILRTIPLEEIRTVSGELIAEGVKRLREGKAEKFPGFDGEYGTIRLFTPEERECPKGQMDFFGALGVSEKTKKKRESVPGSQKEQEKQETTAEKTAETKKEQLNPEQEEAVRTSAGHLAVIAGPGTGKTKTLVARIVYLLEQRKVKPSEITAVTFTNQAAREMKERIRSSLSANRRIGTMQIGTFHALCLEFLKAEGRTVCLADEEEQKEMAKQILAAYGSKEKPGVFLTRVSVWKTGMQTDVPCGNEEAVLAYVKTLKEKKLYDFDDLILETIRQIRKQQGRGKWEKRFRYLLVDEFQDISKMEFELIKAWNASGRELFVIGDPDQSIYSFRGADETCFARLKEQYPDLVEIQLKENYRSTPEILLAAEKVIAENPGTRIRLHANQTEGCAVRIVETSGKKSEAIFIAKEINRLTGGLGMLEAHPADDRKKEKIRSFGDIAVLYRTHYQAEILERCLAAEGIPYQVVGRESWLQEEKVRGSVAFFRYLAHPEAEYAKDESARYLWQTERQVLSETILEETADSLRADFLKKKPKTFMENWMERMNLKDVPEMRKLSQMAICYKTMPDFVNALEMGIESDIRRCGQKEYEAETVTLMTLHGSKGLEYPVVCICGAEEGMIPLETGTHPVHEEEERRLLYVGMTRAKEELILTTAGKKSKFLQTLTGQEIRTEQEKKRKRTEQFHQMSLFE